MAAVALSEAKMVPTGVDFSTFPSSYVRPESERPNLSEVYDSDDLPVIDLSAGDWSLIVKQIGEACRDYGFFQVINHGVPNDVMDEMIAVSKEFFNLPMEEEKLKFYSDDPLKKIRLGTSLNYEKETVHNWRDYLRMHCYPLEEYVVLWPSNPPSFKEIVSKYCKEVRQLNFKLLEAISESLGLDKDFINDTLGEQTQPMVINYFPPCPRPELTYGLPVHTDPNALSILLIDSDVPGLQVLKDDKWISVKPRQHVFVVNIADQIQALSNDIYTSVRHRVIPNSKERISVVSAFSPSSDAIIRAPEALKEEGASSIYRDFTSDEYYKMYLKMTLVNDSSLNLFKN